MTHEPDKKWSHIQIDNFIISLQTCYKIRLEKRPASVPSILLSQGGTILEETVINLKGSTSSTEKRSGCIENTEG